LTDLHKISLGDLQLLVDLPRFQSLRSWAAKNRMTPIAASRVIKRIEDALDTVIIHRSALGFTMTSAGDALIKKSLELLQAASSLSSLASLDPSAGFKRTLTFGSRGFLNVALGGVIAETMRSLSGNEGVRFVDLYPDETLDAMRAGMIDIVLSIGELSVTKDWLSYPVGKVGWSVYGRKNHPLVFSANVSRDMVKYRITHHAYWNGRRIINNEGMAHAVTGAAQNGYGAETAFTALSICQATDQIVYAPRIAAKFWLDLNLIQEIPLKIGDDAELPAVLYVASSRVSKPMLSAMQKELKNALR
jgi:DNA-binding transcriptional LysR family regulator